MKKLLLDENIPSPLSKHFSLNFEAYTVHNQGWSSKKNGELLTAMTMADFDFLLTTDRNLEYQQDLEKYSIKIILLFTFNNRYKTNLETYSFH